MKKNNEIQGGGKREGIRREKKEEKERTGKKWDEKLRLI